MGGDSRAMEPFVNWEMRLGQVSIALDVLTPTTYLMLVATEPWIGGRAGVCVDRRALMLFPTQNRTSS